MKAIINLGNIAVDIKNLELLNKLLANAEKQDYDYVDGKCNYYLRPMPSEGINIQLIPDDLADAQRLVWKLKQDAA